MATYTYVYTNKKYEKFGFEFEITQSMHDDALTVCPNTGEPVKRIIASLSGGHRIGGMAHGNTTMWNKSGDPGPRRKGYDCDPMN